LKAGSVRRTVKRSPASAAPNAFRILKSMSRHACSTTSGGGSADARMHGNWATLDSWAQMIGQLHFRGGSAPEEFPLRNVLSGAQQAHVDPRCTWSGGGNTVLPCLHNQSDDLQTEGAGCFRPVCYCFLAWSTSSVIHGRCPRWNTIPGGSPRTDGLEAVMSMVIRPPPRGALVMCRSP
jgi:hypothetical protein